MKNWLSILVLVLGLQHLGAQVINASVQVLHEQDQTTDAQVYQNLQKALFNYLNGTKWTDRKLPPAKRIRAAFTLQIMGRPAAHEFKAFLSVQSRRPVFNSSYQTTVVNLRDKAVHFKYITLDPLVFNPNRFDSNLVSVMAYYVYLIIGMDADTFSPRGGTPYFRKAQQVVVHAQTSNEKGWSRFDGQRNRATLIDNILSKDFTPLRDLEYVYHRRGLDAMYGQQAEAKNTIAEALMRLAKLGGQHADSYYLQLFFESKADEIAHVFSGGSLAHADLSKLRSILGSLYPAFRDKWRLIKT